MDFRVLRQFTAEQLTPEHISAIQKLALKTRHAIVEMISRAGSGHLGGSLSSVDLYILLWLCADLDPEQPDNPERDRIIISHGHTAPAVYAVLGSLGYVDLEEILATFRRVGSIFEGHPNIKVPGVDWGSGSLGQGLSVGCGMALASKLKKHPHHVFVVMGDGEQQKGQITEAREFASKYRLNNLTAIIDWNRLQASGSVEEVMPQDFEAKYRASGWDVCDIDGHNYTQIYDALRRCYFGQQAPTLVLAHTVMGKGLSLIEGKFEYHGKALSQLQYQATLSEMQGKAFDLNFSTGPQNGRALPGWSESNHPDLPVLPEQQVNYGTPIQYSKDQVVDCRTAFGEALLDLASANPHVTMAVLDCDLAESVKVQKLGQMFPERLIECGIQEHNAATVAGALSKAGVLTFFADFGVFGIDECYSQHRMNDLNGTSLKLICTHNGLDVGEDGKTHQCIDYIAIMSSLWGFKIIIPADANQTDRVIRYVATHPGNFVVALGRSKLPVLSNSVGEVFYGSEYRFEYGRSDWIRTGQTGAIITCGTLVSRAIRAHDRLMQQGVDMAVVNLCSPLELDIPVIRQAAATGLIITYEDHNLRNGIGSLVAAYLAENGLACRFKRIGISHYGSSASPDDLYRSQGLDEDSLTNQVMNEIKKIKKTY